MAAVATGHIAFWESGSLWVFDVPDHPGNLDRNDMHAHHAFQITLAVGGNFKLHLEDTVLAGPAAIVGPDVKHAFEARGAVALLFVEPESRAGRVLFDRLAGATGASLALPVDIAAMIKSALSSGGDVRAALTLAGKQAIDAITGATRAIEPDRRVRLMIKWASDNLSAQPSMTAAAAHVGLSPSRASHLFVSQTGLAFRTYVLWLRVTRAIDAYASGVSLTEAAQEGGFSDSAHLSRTFRRMFGLPAVALQLS